MAMVVEITSLGPQKVSCRKQCHQTGPSFRYTGITCCICFIVIGIRLVFEACAPSEAEYSFCKCLVRDGIVSHKRPPAPAFEFKLIFLIVF